MVESIIQGWLSIWLYVMLAIAIVLGLKMYRNRGEWSKTDLLCAGAIIVLVCHVLEEWVFPGGLHYSYNITFGGTFALSCYPMSRLTDMITNFGAVVLGCIVLKIWGFRKPAAIAVMIFCFAEVAMHVCIGTMDLGRFWEYGMRVVYSPGLITALFGFLPVGIGLARELFGSKPRPRVLDWVLALTATFALAFLLISLPETLLKSTDSPYAFTDSGYYAQYAEQYQADNGYKY